MSDYPPIWRTGVIQARIKAAAGHRCEECGMKFHPDSNLAIHARNRKGQPIVGTVHHINHIKTDCSDNNLVFLCQICHCRAHGYGWVPGKVLPKEWRTPPAWVTARNLLYAAPRQKSLWSETNV